MTASGTGTGSGTDPPPTTTNSDINRKESPWTPTVLTTSAHPEEAYATSTPSRTG
ncbi:hypothetical protein [Salinispora fenicalii]|uniref:hypothetical protein n=1 Tax=Salinispora fenicalii TaxID=1137263 RepID=UPI0004B91B72|nr:hypothetical protein [Salinispora fenicalii]